MFNNHQLFVGLVSSGRRSHNIYQCPVILDQYTNHYAFHINVKTKPVSAGLNMIVYKNIFCFDTI